MTKLSQENRSVEDLNSHNDLDGYRKKQPIHRQLQPISINDNTRREQETIKSMQITESIMA